MEGKNQLSDRVYWLKFFANIFDSKEIIKIRALPSGSDHLILYLRMMAVSVNYGGYIRYEGIDTTPEDEVAMFLHEDPDKIHYAIEVLRRLHLLVDCDNGDFYFPYVVDKIGSESVAAKKMRNIRKRRREEKLLESSKEKILVLPEKKDENVQTGIIPDSTIGSQKVNKDFKNSNGAGLEDSGNEFTEQNRNNVTQCYNGVKQCGNNVIKCYKNVQTGIIPDSAIGSQKVNKDFKNSNGAELEDLGNEFTEQNRNNVITMLRNVTPVDKSGSNDDMPVDTVDTVDNQGCPVSTVKLVPGNVEPNNFTKRSNLYEEEKLYRNNSIVSNNLNNQVYLSCNGFIQPTNNKSSLKSVEYSNNNKEARARAHSVEEIQSDKTAAEDASNGQGEPSLFPNLFSSDGANLLDEGKGEKENAVNHSLSKTANEVGKAFHVFLNEYPRYTRKEKLVWKAFRELVYLKKVDPYDLVDAAKSYAKKTKEEGMQEKYITTALNFLEKTVWLRYSPVYQRSCPFCHGKGVYEEKRENGQTEAYQCNCHERYKKFGVGTD